MLEVVRCLLSGIAPSALLEEHLVRAENLWLRWNGYDDSLEDGKDEGDDELDFHFGDEFAGADEDEFLADDF